MSTTSGSIIPTLFCGGNAEEMVKYYTSIFKDSKIEKTATYPPVQMIAKHGYKEGDVLAITFSLLKGALKMTAVNGPPNVSLSFPARLTQFSTQNACHCTSANTFTNSNFLPSQMFLFNEAVSFTITTADQAETDYYWDKLTADADQNKQFCCWCQDKFGLWWQVVPKEYIALIEGEDKKKAAKTMEVGSTWKKADLEGMRKALEEMEE